MELWQSNRNSTKSNANEIVTDIKQDSVVTENNRIYFYTNINSENALKLNKELVNMSTRLLHLFRIIDVERPKIYLHINSPGGYITDGLSIMDTVNRIKKHVDVYTVIDGVCASAATFISVVGTKRLISEHGYVLFHQLSGETCGTYSQMKDDMINNDEFMKRIKSIYTKYTFVKETELDKILNHDILWDAKKCMELNIVDEIY